MNAPARSSAGAAVASGEPRAWEDSEAPLVRWLGAAVLRSFGRARGSWWIWLAASAVLAGGITFSRLSKPSMASTTVVLRFTEGNLAPEETPASMGTLRSYIDAVAFSRSNLLALAGKHPQLFPKLVKDPDLTLQDIQEATHVVVSGNDFVREREPDDPPRSARVAITYQAASPRAAAVMATELANLLSSVEKARQERELENRAALGAKLEELSRTSGAPGADGANADAARAEDRRRYKQLESARRQVEMARLASRGLDHQQYFQFDMVDPGGEMVVARPPPWPALFLFYLVLILPLAALLFGAFDPRVLDLRDLHETAVLVLGRVPRSSRV